MIFSNVFSALGAQTIANGGGLQPFFIFFHYDIVWNTFAGI